MQNDKIKKKTIKIQGKKESTRLTQPIHHQQHEIEIKKNRLPKEEHSKKKPKLNEKTLTKKMQVNPG